MTRKHFNQIAKVISEAVDRSANSYEVLTLETLAKDLAEVFNEANERFDYLRFLSACGVNK